MTEDISAISKRDFLFNCYVLFSEIRMKITNPMLLRSLFVKTTVTTNFAAINALVMARK